ncbi:hypothetical protein [Cutibacterium avidum]|uniref:hypothetical protein n=1 Tax=Cutibacterium avidum TaxID=33010 RepID=UPI001EF40A68|nr:hypothetical protein [Cutibacterium avidum]
MSLPTFNMTQLKGASVDLTTVGTYTTHETEPEGELTTIVETPKPIPNKQELHKKTQAFGGKRHVSKARITDRDVEYLEFLGNFPAATAEILSILFTRRATRFNEADTITSLDTIYKRLDKMKKLGVVEFYRNPISGEKHYSITKYGLQMMGVLGYDTTGMSRLDGLSLERLNHTTQIARAAATLISPKKFYSDVDFPQLKVNELVSEQKMRADFAPIKQSLQVKNRIDGDGNYGDWRHNELKKQLSDIKNNRLTWDSFIVSSPSLLTVGHPKTHDERLKDCHQPDIAVVPAGRTTPRSENILVEVELSRKSWQEYTEILATFAEEFNNPFVYNRGIYFTTIPQLNKILRAVDQQNGFGLFDKGQLLVLPLVDRDGKKIDPRARIYIGRS